MSTMEEWKNNNLENVRKGKIKKKKTKELKEYGERIELLDKVEQK